MCVSFGLDPRFYSREQILENEAQEWSDYLADRYPDGIDVGGITVWPSRPTTKRTYPIITADGIAEGWWGHLVDGKPATYAGGGVNSKSERFLNPKKMPARAIVPASFFLERLDADTRQWYCYEHGGDLLYLAATVQPGVLTSGERYPCYSILTQDPPPQLAGIHKRTVTLVPPGRVHEWLTSPEPTIVAETIKASAELQTAIEPVHLEGKPA